MRSGGVVAWAALALAIALASAWAVPTLAQNDWQFPDPYFGILEIEKSTPSGGARREQARRRVMVDAGTEGGTRQGWGRRRSWRHAPANVVPPPTPGAAGQQR